MKKKLTLSIDEKILARAKKKCAKEKISLSSLVEGFLLQFIKENP
jgi:predicted HicB family RNase H-like nuclease